MFFKKKKENIQIKRLYVYGNGTYAKTFWDRVEENFNEINKNYNIIDVKNYKFTPGHYVGRNCLGYLVHRGDELIIDYVVELRR